MKERDQGCFIGKLFLGALLVVSLGVTGCATQMVMTPQIAVREGVNMKIKGKIICDGNREYLPRTIAEGKAEESGLSFLYMYKEAYGRDNMHPLVPLFNPLSIIGFPIGENTLVVVGKLDVYKGDAPVKTYTATCAMNKDRNLFSEGETFSEMRKKGLLNVRDNIEAQMYEDQEYLGKLSAGM